MSVAAGSIPLVGFGLDGLVEVFAVLAVREGLEAWRGEMCCDEHEAGRPGIGA